MFLILILFIVVRNGFSIKDTSEILLYRNEIDVWLNRVNDDLMQFNAISATLTWDLTLGNVNEQTEQVVNDIVYIKNQWRNKICESRVMKDLLTYDQSRMLYLLCRGPKFTDETAQSELHVLNEMRSAAQADICLDEIAPTLLEELMTPGEQPVDYPRPGECLAGEPDLENLMKRSDLNAAQLKWVWTSWHNAVGLATRHIFPKVVRLQNFVAQANGYDDMGAVWRDELEIPNLQVEVIKLYSEIFPLYEMLHAVLRHKIHNKYGPNEVDLNGLLPVHLLGNMWGQNWVSLINLFFPANETINLDDKLKSKGWSVRDMVLQAEDFYTSLGLPAMTDKFWKYSKFEEDDNSSMCHGTAANMFRNDDYRILLCAKQNMEDFYVIHHELGHTEYNMAYKDQPAIYQEGTNSAFHETIGDVIMHGVLVPQHLHRLGVLKDNDLLNKNVDKYLLLHQALSKIPEIPFALIIDLYRWNIFNGKIREEEYNTVYWNLHRRYRGVKPAEERGEMYFDAGAKFHIPDNTPYIRYFLSSILQMQIFKGLCDISLFGKFHNDDFEEELKIPLHRCDIYGCKKCGRLLKKAMSLGASAHWTKVLEILTGQNYISTKPILEFYAPVYKWLKEYVLKNNVTIGW